MKNIVNLAKNRKLILIFIILLAAILRFVNLGSYPALNADEAAIGYNAYSLIKTGKDEHGNPWPIHFQSFNDYKPGLYFYVVLPFVKILGLNEWAVRLPGATAGVLTILVVYLLVKELFGENEKFALLSSFLLAISPWHIHFSRGGWEVNFATFLATAGILFFVKSARGNFNIRYLFLSMAFFVASFYTYHSVRIVVPLLLLTSLFIYKSTVFANWKKILVAGMVGMLLCVPLLFDLTKPSFLSRAQGVGILADLGPKSRVEEQRVEHRNYSNIIPRVIHNKLVNYGLVFFQNWSKHYWGEFLFLSGDVIQRNKVPETGQLYMFEIITVTVGLYLIAKSKDNKWLVIILWLLFAPVAAALTFQSPHSLRAQNMVIPITIVSAYGLNIIINFISRKKFKYAAYFVILAIVFLSFGRYLHMYYVHMAKEYPYSAQYGVKELVEYISQNSGRYSKVMVTDRYDQPYILFLFYTKYPPEKFQSQHRLTGRDKFGFSTVNSFDKYYFGSIKFDEDRPDNPNSLIVGTDEEIPNEANIVKNIYGSNGFLYFQVVEN